MTEPTRPNPEAEHWVPSQPDLCQHCRHAWHGFRCHCSCPTSFEPKGGQS